MIEPSLRPPLQRFVKTLSHMGLTGQEIAEAMWLALQTENEVIDVVVQPVTTEDDGTSSDDKINENIENRQSPDSPSPSEESESDGSAELIPAPVEDTPSLALPPNYTPIPVPDAPSISQALQLARTLRPLARKVAVGLPRVIDEAATVDQVAETGVYQLVLKPESELWLNVALVFDTSSSMCLWQRLRVDLHRLLSRYGEFQDVRIWTLQYDAPDRVNLFSLNGVSHQPRELLTGDRRCLVIVVSDCVAPAWHNGAMRDVMSVWSETLPTVVFHVFPERLWSRTALARSVTVELKSRQPGAASNTLEPSVRSYWDQERLKQSVQQANRVTLPVVSIEPDSLSNWAKMVAGDRRARVLGIVWDAPPVTMTRPRVSAPPSEAAIKERVDSFLLTASPTARHLASLVAVAPVITLPIVRLIRQSMLRQASAVHIAEVFMSGLLKASGSQTPNFENAERIAYQLIDDEVRDRLRLDSQGVDTITVLNQVSLYVAQGLGKSISQFKALLRTTSSGESEPETAFLSAFATVTAKILQGLGSDYQDLAQSLGFPTPETLTTTREDNEWLALPLEEFEYMSVQWVEPPSDPEAIAVPEATDFDQLESFPIRIATFEGQGFEWVVNYKEAEVQCYVESLTENTPLELARIPSGDFVMGAPKEEEGYDPVDGPQHLVSVPEFWMGRYPVTQQEWHVVAGFEKVNLELNPDPSGFKGDRLPVEQVNWYEAMEFCDRLSQRTGRNYRLPSEAEWEYACRAGTKTPFHFGPTLLPHYSNYRATETYGSGEPGTYRQKTVAVDYFQITNDFGLCDMHGNVREWCLDHWHETYDGAPVDGSAWTDEWAVDEQRQSTEQRRVRRGGSWDFNPKRCRSAYRSAHAPSNRYYSVGFRVVLSPSTA